MNIEIRQVDYNNPKDAEALIAMLDAYARDPMGGAEPLSEYTRRHLASSLAQRADAFSVLAFADGEPAGMVNCFEGFSTFKCKPLVNIHDFAVAPAYRGKGIAQKMMVYVEELARQRGCCKVTLEVLEGNRAAQQLYAKLGYTGYQLVQEMGDALFWQKLL
ncbi:MAG: GNAT family N-acetyltransferase [Burkholderiaceae bacterium]|nr:GNAT family N-acetyltransferase [Burkholderiaceae bacterium]